VAAVASVDNGAAIRQAAESRYALSTADAELLAAREELAQQFPNDGGIVDLVHLQRIPSSMPKQALPS